MRQLVIGLMPRADLTHMAAVFRRCVAQLSLRSQPRNCIATALSHALMGLDILILAYFPLDLVLYLIIKHSSVYPALHQKS